MAVLVDREASPEMLPVNDGSFTEAELALAALVNGGHDFVDSQPDLESTSTNGNALLLLPNTTKSGESSKNGDSVQVRNSIEAGIVVHAVIAHQDDGNGGVREWVKKQYKNSPLYIRKWAKKTADSIDTLQAILPQSSETTEVNILSETQLYVPNRARRAARALADLLGTSRLRGRNIGYQVENALRSNPYILRPGGNQVDNDFEKNVRELPDDLALSDGTVVSHDQLLEYAELARTLHSEFNGDLQMSQSVRTDMIITEHEKHDSRVSFITKSFIDILETGDALDPVAVESMIFTSDTEEGFLTGTDIIAKAAELISTQKLRLKLYDIKTLTHNGALYEGLEEIWDDHEGNLQSIFSPANLAASSPAHARLRELISKNIFDVAKTYGTLMNLFRMAIKAKDLALSIESVMDKVDYGILFADFDIRSKSTKRPHTRATPESVNFEIVNIPYDLILDRWNSWTRNLYEKLRIGELLLSREVMFETTSQQTN